MERKRIGIWTGPSWEQWDLESYKNEGIGGSEICAGRLAQTAVDNGHTVTMYGHHETKEQHGIQLIPWKEFDPEKESFDLFIASRNISCIDEKLNAKKILVWIHDIQLASGIPATDFQRSMISKFIVLSPWHQQFIKYILGLKDEEIEIIPNGVNVELFEEYNPDEKIFGKLIWPSHPDRGLNNLLYMLPQIKEKVPEVHLEVAYGMKNCMSAAIREKNALLLKFYFYLKSELQNTDYVNYHGRMSQPSLAKLWAQSYLWLYPTSFPETYCLSAKEAQVSGTPIICSNLAALKTTVGDYGCLLDVDTYSDEGRDKFVKKTIEILQNRDQWLEMSAKSRKGAENISWGDRWKDYWEKWLE